MELLGVFKAQAVWLFDANDLNPRGKYIFPDLIDWLRKTYQFQQTPKSPNDVDESKGLAFKQGAFRLGADLVTVEFTLYTDGVIANTYSSTQATDLFIEDVIKGARQEFGLKYAPNLVRSKTYLSEVTVRLDASFSKINPKLSAFADKVSKAHEYPGVGSFEIGGISFWTDNSKSVLKMAPFTIERKVNAPFSENRYFSRASLNTEVHLKLVTEFESMIFEPPAL
jgi:hypothetical protein